MLVYKVPSEPSARRVYVWRKLKRLGALLQHDSLWILPATEYTREQFEWLAAEILEFGGDAHVWEAELLLPQTDEALIYQFTEQVDALYRELMEELDQADPDYSALSKRYQQIKTQDYFNSSFGENIRRALLRARGDGEE